MIRWGDGQGKAEEFNRMGDLFMEQGDFRQADSFFQQSLETAATIKSKEKEKDAYLAPL